MDANDGIHRSGTDGVRLPALAGYTSRPATQGDLDELIGLVQEADRIDHPTYLTTREELADDLENSKVDLALDTVVIAGAGGAVVAFGYVLPAAVAETAERVYLFGAVHPGSRGLGIGREVLAWQEQRGDSGSRHPLRRCLASS